MKALTLWQPWASLVVEGAKPYEFRGWRAPESIVGQRIVIHASVRQIDRVECFRLLEVLERREQYPTSAAMTCLHAEKAIPVLMSALDSMVEIRESRAKGRGDLPWGCGIGTAIVGESRLGTEIAEELGFPRANDSDRDQHANWDGRCSISSDGKCP